MTHNAQNFDGAAVRQLLLAAFTAEELRRFCYDRPSFRPVTQRLGPGDGLEDLVDELIPFCETRLLMPELLSEVREANPRQYARFEAALSAGESPAAPGDWRFYYERGKGRYRQGDLAGAIADYDQVVALKPDYAAAYLERGVARRAQGDLEGAIEDLDRAIALDPGNALAYRYRGSARKAQGDLAGAIEDYETAIALSPRLLAAHYALGEARLAQGDVATAIQHYEWAYQLARDGGESRTEGLALAALGVAHAELDEADRAREYYGRAVRTLESIQDPTANLVRRWLAELEE